MTKSCLLDYQQRLNINYFDSNMTSCDTTVTSRYNYFLLTQRYRREQPNDVTKRAKRRERGILKFYHGHFLSEMTESC